MSRMHQAWAEALQRGEQRRHRMAQRLPSWRTRPRRRALVALWLPVPLALIVLTLTLDWDNPVTSLVYLAVLAVWYPFWLVLRVLTTASAEAIVALLDEREVEVRNRLSFVSLSVLSTANLLIVFYLIFNHDDPLIAIRTAYLLIACILLAASVPTALLAWRMPDDDPEDLENPDRPADRAGNDEGGISA
ncbi:hypothetical protein FHX42_004143 [Saccharopolyspora lacisalsi]|uniref:Uncharacterized protein n=1 Tax=Halosaccharopolyspora lacisalsi TaxID=1000566 RepID=A0A839DZ40_9PSEU|nr:hypothetical protein [Halosaccharopolyspora lacisalsi]MBA8826764.1 hypothetical protein [Halosaccharopolyspora lacisalsi]